MQLANILMAQNGPKNKAWKWQNLTKILEADVLKIISKKIGRHNYLKWKKKALHYFTYLEDFINTIYMHIILFIYETHFERIAKTILYVCFIVGFNNICYVVSKNCLE